MEVEYLLGYGECVDYYGFEELDDEECGVLEVDLFGQGYGWQLEDVGYEDCYDEIGEEGQYGELCLQQYLQYYELGQEGQLYLDVMLQVVMGFVFYLFILFFSCMRFIGCRRLVLMWLQRVQSGFVNMVRVRVIVIIFLVVMVMMCGMCCCFCCLFVVGVLLR